LGGFCEEIGLGSQFSVLDFGLKRFGAAAYGTASFPAHSAPSGHFSQACKVITDCGTQM
jgi:hypothetical protein